MTDPTDPTDETQPHPNPTEPANAPPAGDPTPPAPAVAQSGGEPATGEPARPRTVYPSSVGQPPRSADSERPADSGWREPPWFPPRHRDRDRRPGLFALAAGLILIAIGIYYFVDRTLGIAMPRIQWGSLWPVLLIVVGGLILLRSIQRR